MSEEARSGPDSQLAKRFLVACVWTLLLGIVAVVALVVASWLMFGGRGRMTAATSPDGRYRITLDERALGFDRHFRLLLWDREAGQERVLDCPNYDQSPAAEREHFVWSADSRMVALVGDHFYTIPEGELPSGYRLYVVYDTAEDRLFCNIDWAADSETPFPANRAVEVFGEAILATPELIR